MATKSQFTLLTISLPRKMAKEVEHLKRAEHRTRSELVREALRAYLAIAKRFPEEEANPAELRALARGRREIARGDYITLDQLRRELDRSPRKLSRKKHQARARG